MRHGNGFQLQGLEETLHTMKEGGVRRVIIPPHMGFVSSDVGPVPEWARDRKKLNEALKQSGEFVVMDVELVEVKNIPDPHGYYSDSAPTTQEQLAKEIRETKMRRSKATASE
uniref:peptidylprolyl isomerase n=1 Tax=Erythrolobus australicus TaxID=1077150 RepID=A0A7S1XIC3_9RHOD|mmetsp:Transcript_2760/g.7553  ORF Transcript_2760/g.7553 Transcript_2760/m.7553 type:complete len:113 (+) Transcript_2760:666-1004(+)